MSTNDSAIKMTNLLNLDVIETAQLIRSRQQSIKQIVTTYIEQIKRVNPTINAVIAKRFDSALAEAEEKDYNFPPDLTNYPLYGVPITVKESFDVSQMKTTGGLIQLKDRVATNDAPIIKTLKDAGAIIIGKTNTATLCYAQESTNKLFGRTNNPWDVTKTAGGSTGGEGAILAVGGAAAGVGSDIGGSIRVPSHFNGVIGFKSGKYTLISDGHLPASTIALQQRMESFGPMGKSVRDMKLLYEIMTQTTIKPTDLTNIKINVLPTNVSYPLDEVTKNLLDQVANFLHEHHSVERIVPPYFENSAELWQEIMSIDGSQAIETLAFQANPSTPRLLWTYIKEKLSQQTDWHHYLLWALLGTKLFKPNKKRIKEIEKVIQKGDDEIHEQLKNRLLIFPVYHSATKPHGKVFQEIFSIKKTFKQYMPYLAYANVWGLPSLTIPLSKDSGLPIALQIMGLVGNEAQIFALGKMLEKQFTGYVRCETFDQHI